jgi:hypothetical protein
MNRTVESYVITHQANIQLCNQLTPQAWSQQLLSPCCGTLRFIIMNTKAQFMLVQASSLLISIKTHSNIILSYLCLKERLCGLVVRAPG